MSPAVVELMEELVTDPRRQQTFRRSPQEYVADRGLSPAERATVTCGDVGRIREMLTAHSPLGEHPGALVFLLVLASALDEAEAGPDALVRA